MDSSDTTVMDSSDTTIMASSDTTAMDTQECPKAEPTAEIILILKMMNSGTKKYIPKAKP